MATGIKGDTSTPELLFRTGALVRGRKDPTKAIGIWGLIGEKYPDSKWAAEAMFQNAFTFDNDLQDKQTAKVYYEKFLTTYPNHKLSEDVKLLIPTLEKTDAQLIEEFEKKNKLK
jgi:TolA-binding protein